MVRKYTNPSRSRQLNGLLGSSLNLDLNSLLITVLSSEEIAPSCAALRRMCERLDEFAKNSVVDH